MEVPLYPTLAIGAVTVVVWYAISRWQQRKCYPPGPYPLPMIGNMIAIMSTTDKLWVYCEKLSRKYGDVFTLFLATKPLVILGSLKAVREAFIAKQNDFAGRPVIYSFDYSSKGGKDIAGGQVGPIWKKQRKIVHAALRKFASGECLENLVHQSFQQLCIQLDKVADTGKKFNPEDSLNHTIYNIIYSMVFGKTFDYGDPYMTKYIKLQDELNDAFSSGLMADFIPVFKYIPSKGIRALHKGVHALNELVAGIYEEHKKNFNESTATNPKDMVDYILQTIQEVEKKEGVEGTEGLTEDHYQMIISDIFSAGTDTTRLTFLWVVLFVAAFPECKKKLQQEVDEVLGAHDKFLEHQACLPYTEAFLHEVMRMRPIAPMALPHTTTCNTSVGGYPIPAGTIVMPNIWAIHMDKETWGDPDVFRPERFLGEDGKMGPRNLAWLPFSTGRRVCVGEAVAKAELHLLLSLIIQKYDICAPAGIQMDISPKKNSQMMVPNDYKVIINHRA